MQATTENLIKVFDNCTVDDFHFEFYMMWCESVTINERELQQVLACAAINRWFNVELAKHIKEYYLLARNYPNATDDDCFQLYIKCIYHLFSIHPKSLLEQAKKRDKQTAKVEGIKVSTTIFNHN